MSLDDTVNFKRASVKRDTFLEFNIRDPIKRLEDGILTEGSIISLENPLLNTFFYDNEILAKYKAHILAKRMKTTSIEHIMESIILCLYRDTLYIIKGLPILKAIIFTRKKNKSFRFTANVYIEQADTKDRLREIYNRHHCIVDKLIPTDEKSIRVGILKSTNIMLDAIYGSRKRINGIIETDLETKTRTNRPRFYILSLAEKDNFWRIFFKKFSRDYDKKILALIEAINLKWMNHYMRFKVDNNVEDRLRPFGCPAENRRKIYNWLVTIDNKSKLSKDGKKFYLGMDLEMDVLTDDLIAYMNNM